MKYVLLVFVVFVVGGCNYGNYDRYDYLYCDMVNKWKEDTEAGVELYDRRGWAPILDDNIQCSTRRSLYSEVTHV